MKIKIIHARCSNQLEHEVNRFLVYYKNKIKILDIKYYYQECYEPRRTFWGVLFFQQYHNFDAMIIYESKTHKEVYGDKRTKKNL